MTGGLAEYELLRCQLSELTLHTLIIVIRVLLAISRRTDLALFRRAETSDSAI